MLSAVSGKWRTLKVSPAYAPEVK